MRSQSYQTPAPDQASGDPGGHLVRRLGLRYGGTAETVADIEATTHRHARDGRPCRGAGG